MKIINCTQGTLEWLETRRCMVTGTKMDSVMGTPWEQLQLICELIAEEATEQIKEVKSTPIMERGSAEEVFARKHYEEKFGRQVEQLGFCVSEEFPYLGISGDGWMKEEKVYLGATEIKSPDTSTAVFYHLCNYLSAEELELGTWSKSTPKNPEVEFKPSAKAPFLGIPAIYKWQIVTYFLVNPDLKKLDFLIWDPRFIDERNKMMTITLLRENEILQEAINEARETLISFREKWMKYREFIIKDNF